MASKHQKFQCPYCEAKLIRPELIEHIEKNHQEELPEGYSATRVVYHIVNNMTERHCRVCGRPTSWNEKTGKYNQLCDDPKCKEKLCQLYRDRAVKARGTYEFYNDPEHQKKMLKGRKISGTYIFTDGGKIDYVGQYERKCLEFMDKVMMIPSKDIATPGPTIKYQYNGEEHFYIPDIYYIPFNLIIEIKDGGQHPNMQQSPSRTVSREKTVAKEKVITDQGEFNYVRLTDNNFAQLIEIFMELKEESMNGEFENKRVVRVHEDTIRENMYTDNYYRVTYNGIGIYEAFKVAAGPGVWLNCKTSPAFTWLPLPPNYAGNYYSYFTEEGYITFKRKTLPLMVKYLDPKKINVVRYTGMNNRVVYKDKYQIVVEQNPDTLNENTLIIDDCDVYYNKAEFRTGQVNICFTTGETGPGVKYYLDEIKDLGIEVYKMDDILNNHLYSDDDIKKFGKLGYSFFKENPRYRLPYRSSPFTRDQYIKANSVTENEYYYDNMAVDFVKYAISYAKIHKKDRFYIDGVWMVMFRLEPETFDDCAFFIEGMSMKVKYNRVGKRNVSLQDNVLDKLQAATFGSVHDQKVLFEKRLRIYIAHFRKISKVEIMESVEQDTNMLNEACKDLKTARQFVTDVGKLAKKYDANYFIVTDGASGYSNNGNEAVRNARRSQEEWERENGFDPDEDWSGSIKEDQIVVEQNPDTLNEAYRDNIKTEYLEKTDSCFNLDKWSANGENILYVTGLSGSGKTTLGEAIAEQYKCGRVELDYISVFYLRKIQERPGGPKGKYDKLKAICPEAVQFLSLNHIDKYGIRERFSDTMDICNDFIVWFNENFKSNGKLYVINGAQIPSCMYHAFYYDKPLILKNPNYFKTSLRRIGREVIFNDEKDFFEKLEGLRKQLKLVTGKSYRGARMDYKRFNSELKDNAPVVEETIFGVNSLRGNHLFYKIPNVYFTRVISPYTVVRLYKMLNHKLPGNVAVKLHSGEVGNKNFLGPDFWGELIRYVDGTVVECNTAYESQRNTTKKHIKVLKDHKWSEYFDVDIMDAEGDDYLPVYGGNILEVNAVGKHIHDYDSMLVLSHFKGHAMGGYGGALKNISIGVASAAGKKQIHRVPSSDMVGFGIKVDQNEFLMAMADAAKSVVDYFDGNMVFINAMVNISVDCDCAADAHPPCMKDIGLLISDDPVAIDQACIDLIYKSDDKGRDTLLQRIKSRQGEDTIKYANDIGVGSYAYNFIDLDQLETMREGGMANHSYKNHDNSPFPSKPGTIHNDIPIRNDEINDISELVIEDEDFTYKQEY